MKNIPHPSSFIPHPYSLEWAKWVFKPPAGERSHNLHVQATGRANQTFGTEWHTFSSFWHLFIW